MEYVMYGKLLTHLRDQRSKQTSLFHFTEEVHILITYLIIISGIETVIKDVSKKRSQHWHSHCDFSMLILANYYFILQISHTNTFKMRLNNSR